MLEDPLCEEFLRILCPPDCDIDRLEGDLIAMGVAVEDQTTRGMELAALALTIPSGLAVLSISAARSKPNSAANATWNEIA